MLLHYADMRVRRGHLPLASGFYSKYGFHYSILGSAPVEVKLGRKAISG